MFGCGSIAQSVLSLGLKGDFFSINWGWVGESLFITIYNLYFPSWCVGAVLGLLLSSEVSGGHINPAVTVALATLGKFPWRKVPHYLAAQYLGAFVASAVVFLVYWDALVWYEHDRGMHCAQYHWFFISDMKVDTVLPLTLLQYLEPTQVTIWQCGEVLVTRWWGLPCSSSVSVPSLTRTTWESANRPFHFS